jgi:hypothetical protein
MLDKARPQQKQSLEDAFRKWWSVERPRLGDQVSESVARTVFKAGYATGRRPNLDRYVFAVGRFRITVWATGLINAKRMAAAEADVRAARRGWKRPKAGWVLKEVL